MSIPADFAAPSLPERIGPFTIHGVLGRGGMAVVFDARTEDGRDVALKVVRPVGDAERARLLVARFVREAKILEQLDHPGVVGLVASGTADDGVFYLAMERIEGVSLLTIRRRGPLEFIPLVELGVYLADALAHMHAAGVVHRDIKPANILVGAGGRPVITDFGISGMSEATGITRQGDLLGSPGFMAPEVVDGGSTSPASDQFALGRLLFELGARGAAPKLPKNAPILDVLRVAMEIQWDRFPTDDRWPEVGPILRRMLARGPGDRYPDMAATTEALRGLLPTGDVLDVETLSEQIERMDLKVSKSWEILADDLDLPVDDELMNNLDLPAGERSPEEDDDAFDDRTQLQDGPPVAPSAPSAPNVTQRLPAFPAAPFAPDQHAEPTRPPARPDDTRPPSPHDKPTAPSDPAAVTAAVPMPNPKADSRPAVPLASLVETIPPEAPPDTTHDPRDLAALARMERQLSRMRDELAAARTNAGELRSSRTIWRLLVGAAVIVGAVVGFLVRPVGDLRPSLVLVPPTDTRVGPPKFRADPTRPISADDRRDAAEMLEAAQERLAKRDLDGAERLLGLCIDVADLPACHKTLATMLTLTGDHERARAHFEHFLDTAPSDPDAARVRELLRE